MDRQRHFGFLLKDVSRLAARNFEAQAEAAGLGLTLSQCKVLIHLQRNQGITQVRLAELTDTDPMTLVRILDRMEQDGWLERRPDPADRRVRRLHLKPAAQPVVRQIWTLADRARDEAFDGIGEAEQDLLLDLLERIHGNLAARVSGTAESASDQSAQATAPTAATKAARTPTRTTRRKTQKASS